MRSDALKSLAAGFSVMLIQIFLAIELATRDGKPHPPDPLWRNLLLGGPGGLMAMRMAPSHPDVGVLSLGMLLNVCVYAMLAMAVVRVARHL